MTTVTESGESDVLERPSAPPSMVAGRYRVISKIAEGGMGAVYLAEHALSKKRLALKILHPHLSHGRQAVERFKREVSAAAEIDHPGIVQVFDAGVDNDGAFYMAMELLKGESLGDCTRRHWPGMKRTVELVVGMCDPLARAHDKGFVHRDLKPDNIFIAIDDEGRERVKLLDFGLAREVSRKGPTMSGITFGTPEYMSPEQAMSAKRAGVPSDVWSVGVMLYELLSGEHPFTGETPNAVMANAIKEPHKPIRELVPAVPEQLAAVIEACLLKDPKKRPATAGVVGEMLRDVLDKVALDDSIRPVDPALVRARWDAEQGGEHAAGEAGEPTSGKRSLPTTDGRLPILKKRPLLPWLAVGAGALALAGIAAALAMRSPRASTATELPMEAAEHAETSAGEAALPSEGIAELASPAARRAASRAGGGVEGQAASDALIAELAASEAQTAEVTELAPTGPLDEDEAGPTPRRVRRASASDEAPPDLEAARACLARGDTRCAVDTLRGSRNRASMELLIDLLEQQGRASEATTVMQSYVTRFRRGGRSEAYQRRLGLAGH